MTMIKVPAAYTALKRAEQSFRPVMMLASAGWGKTSAVKYYYRNRAVLWLSGLQGKLDSMPDLASARQGVVVIDDVSYIDDIPSEQYILELLRKNDRQLVLIGRGGLPAWLSAEIFSIEFVYITEKDLVMDEKQIRQLFEGFDISLSEDQAEMLREHLRGYPPALRLCLIKAQQGAVVEKSLLPEVRVDLFHYYDHAVYHRLPEEVQEMLLSVCRYPWFTPEFAAHLTGRHDVPELVLYCRRIGSFLVRQKADRYTLLDDMKNFLCWKQEIVWPQSRIIDNYRRAADAYKHQGDISEALYYYDQAGAMDEIRQALIDNAHRHPGVGQYYELRHYYQELPVEMLRESPVLMAGMSVLYSMTLRVEESERWYGELASFAGQEGISAEQRREAMARLAYLDIGLPHRAGHLLPDVISQLIMLQQEEGVILPELSVTDNSPSLMNSGLDFCEWARDAGAFMKASEKPLEMLLGEFGKGLANVALAESGFEQSSMPPYEVTTRLHHGYAAADHGGKIEMCFAAQGVLIRQQVSQGHIQAARKALSSFARKAEAAAAAQLLPNIEALGVWLSLYSGELADAEEFIENVPDPHIEFYTMNRVRYMVKLRCLIAREEYLQARDIAGYLEHYFAKYGRIYHQIENHVLQAIILYRTGHCEWRELMTQALSQAEEYRLTRVISLEGAAVLPLLAEMKGEAAQSSKGSFTEAFRKTILEETRSVALFYPEYLKHTPKVTINLTAREQEILGLLCAGRTMEEICEQCGISYSGLKKHNRNIYSKLGVKTRAEAERAAVRMGLTHRK